jgi:hypothetical protein
MLVRAAVLVGLISCYTADALNVRQLGKPFYAKHKSGGRVLKRTLSDAAHGGHANLRGDAASSGEPGPGTLSCPSVSATICAHPFYLCVDMRLLV